MVYLVGLFALLFKNMKFFRYNITLYAARFYLVIILLRLK